MQKTEKEKFNSEIVFTKGLDEIESLVPEGNTVPSILVLDDCMDLVSKSEYISSLFCRVSHHRNLTVILLLQNLFYKGPFMRTINLNPRAMVLFNNPRDSSRTSVLSRQLGGNKKNPLFDYA